MMAVAMIDRGPVAPEVGDHDALARIERLLDLSSAQPVRFAGAGGEEIEAPRSLLRALRQVVHALASDRAVAIVPIERALTTQQAADLLNVSRPYLVRLLDEGVIPHTRTGAHRRVHFDDLVAYKRERDARRREGLRRLTQMSQELGLYATD